MVGGFTVSGIMKRIVFTVMMAALMASPAAAQDAPEKPECEDGILALIVPEGGKDSYYECTRFGENTSDVPKAESDADETANAEDFKGLDYSDLTEEAERTAKLDSYFERLKAETNPEDANLIAEDIWAVWLDSGSYTVNFILRRGTSAQKRNDIKLARRMYDHVTTLNPDYAEGWARSSRLALEEKDLSRALNSGPC